MLVNRKPVVAILSTGNELVDLQQGSPRAGSTGNASWSGIWDTNRPTLHTAISGMGYEVVDLGIVRDE